MTSFLDEASSYLTPELIGKAAKAFGVPSDGVQKAIGAALPTVLGSIAGKADQAGFMSDLFHMVTQPAAAGASTDSALGAISAMASGAPSPLVDISKRLLGSLFGGSGDSLGTAIGRMAGAGSAGNGILGTVGALAVSMLGSRVRGGGLNAAGLAGALLGEKDALLKAIPASFAGMLPVKLPGTGATDRKAGPAPVHGYFDGTQMFGFSMAIMGAALLVWYGAQLRKKPVEPVAVAPAVEVPAPAPAPATGLQGLTLPNGTVIQVSPSGIESQMVAFITDSTRAIDKTTWFDFDRLLFETGSAVLVPSSLEQLSNINEILKAFPAVKLKLGGYTDNVGQAAANMKLSADRANTAMAELVKLGVAADRLEAEGYGDTVPVADNSTEEGRAKNRRTAARVTAK
ncbi:MAG: OmpA family protein [Gemmatimonadaceae bacterium]|nr:OmpA family protein [Gemmatimonadaceae bacterium]